MKPDISLSREQYRRRAWSYNYVGRWSEPIRRLTVQRLRLQRGDVVLDVGCGTGLSFPFLERKIGPEGRIIGVDPSLDMLAQARDRAERNGWQNVVLIESAAEDALIPELVDALLFHFTHDVMRSSQALENVFRQAKPGARVAAAGMKWAPLWALPANPVIWFLSRNYVTTFEGFRAPWSHLERLVPDLRVAQLLVGAVYIAWGVFQPEGGTRQ